MAFSGLRRIKNLREKPTISNENRASFVSDQWKGIRVKFLLQTTAGGVAFLLWFLACCSYLFGTLYKSPSRHHNFKVLAVNYDGGVVGAAMDGAYQQLKGPGFFTINYHTPEEFPTEADMYKAVWEGKYWGAISATEGASVRLARAIEGVNATTYNPANALHYIWNQQRYTAFSNSVVQAHMQQLVSLTRIVYNKMNGTQASQFLDRSNSAAVQALLNPISATATDIKEAPFGSVILLNTVSMAMPILQQFFFLLVINGVMRQHQLYNKMTVRSSLLLRRISGLIFTLGASLCQTGYFWAYRENWNVNGNQFVLTWMTFWLLMNIHYLILDTISTVAPLPAMPFVVLLWVFLNIASTLSPLELQPAFYRWGIALPSHNAYSILITIWSGGSDNRLYRALPILFSWWVLANITTSLTHIRACHLAYKLEEETGGLDEQHHTKDEEAGVAFEGNDNASVSRQTTLNRPTTNLQRQRTFEETALEQRQVYGPSIPPF